ncbi:YdeI/OmpD-associated family protein [Chitinophaga sp. 22536]|uniref:YdeI/OmpD-associated family protein n=1 Tax=unclassified Chitinophaga TaxID=2619133 RepID=UPI003F84589A
MCFGWIDSKAKKRDEESFYLTFTPRKAKSKWSKPNIERAQRMIATGQMTVHGQEKIDLAKRTGMWTEE